MRSYPLHYPLNEIIYHTFVGLCVVRCRQAGALAQGVLHYGGRDAAVVREAAQSKNGSAHLPPSPKQVEEKQAADGAAQRAPERNRARRERLVRRERKEGA